MPRTVCLLKRLSINRVQHGVGHAGVLAVGTQIQGGYVMVQKGFHTSGHPSSYYRNWRVCRAEFARLESGHTAYRISFFV